MSILPDPFLFRIKETLPDWDQFIAAHENPNVRVSVRNNPAKPSHQHQNLSRVPWATSGYYLPERPSFTLDPLLHAGAYYVQEASSMLLEQAIIQSTDISQPQIALDLCAAPGGKSTHLLSLLNSDSLLGKGNHKAEGNGVGQEL